MEKAELKNIFESPFNLEKWHTVMQSLFRVKTIRQQPREIPLAPNDLAYDAFELGDTTTSDERVIGFYLVNLKPGVWIEVNRVGLRNLLRNVYNNDVDGALIVFQLGEKWRFSYVSQIREIDDEGNFVKTETEPKRYTYLMGKDEICRTAADRFHLLSGKPIALNDIKEAFSVEKLNKEFYNELSNWYFWALLNVTFPNDFEKDEEVRNATSVIRLITRLIFVWFLKQKKLIPEELFDEREIKHLLNFTDKTGSTYYKAILQNLFFATLNTEMGCDKRKFVNRQYGVQGFYRYERFFNNKERFLQLTQNIPFLNGGLFENLDKNVGEPGEKRIDCFSNKIANETRLSVPDYLFFAGTDHADLSRSYPDNNHGNVKIRGLIQLLKSYNFTIEENTPFEIEVALDPELLGKVFENLLASYNPETKTTARKQTGSFYTPREIVNYMVDESLIAFLKNQLLEENPGVKVLGKSQIEMFGNETRKGQLTFEQKINESRWIGKEQQLEDNLRLMLDFNNEKNPFDEKDSMLIMKAIDACTILDPACGSGAFPMGILQKLVLILQKLDKNNEYWRKIQEERAKAENEALINRIQKDKEYAEHISFEDIRKKLLKELDERLEEIRDSFDINQNEPDYARKLFLVENCIYGVDIQPIAVQIAKLRFFISLIIDQKIDDSKRNRGILTLPNLETKFVAANTLIGLSRVIKAKPIAVYSLEDSLKDVRHRHFSARTPETKKKYREQDTQLREKISTELKKVGFPPTDADQIAHWNPYDQNTSATFFDAEWMFGIKKGFDIVIGNPPWGAKLSSEEKENFKLFYPEIDSSTPNSFAYFIGWAVKNYNGVISYVLPDSILIKDYAKTRKLIKDNIFEIHWYENSGISEEHRPFVYVDHDVCIINISKKKSSTLNYSLFRFDRSINLVKETKLKQDKSIIILEEFDFAFNLIAVENDFKILKKIQKFNKLNDFMQCHEGIHTGNIRDLLFSKLKNSIHCHSLFYGGSAGDIIENYVSNTSGWYVDYRPEIIDKSKGYYASLRDERIFKFPKIYITRTGNPFKAFYDDDTYASNNFFSLQHVDYSKNSNQFLKIILPFIISKISQYFIRTFAAPRLGSTFIETKIFHLLKFRIPKISDFENNSILNLVDQILSAKKSNSQADTLEWEAEIDARVFQLYGLTEEEINQVLASLPGVTEREKQAIRQKWEELKQID